MYYRYIVEKDGETGGGIFRPGRHKGWGTGTYEYKKLRNSSFWSWRPIKPYKIWYTKTQSWFTAEGSKKAQPKLREMRKFLKEYGCKIRCIKRNIPEDAVLYSDEYQVFVREGAIA